MVAYHDLAAQGSGEAWRLTPLSGAVGGEEAWLWAAALSLSRALRVEIAQREAGAAPRGGVEL